MLNYTINITALSPITLTANESNDFTIYRHFGNGYLFNVSSGTFILEGNSGHNLTIDGNKTTDYVSNGKSLVYVNGGEFTMSAGSVLQNSNTPAVGGGVYVYGGTFNMNDSATVDSDNEVYLYSGRFVTVTGNFAPDAGALNITPGYTSGTVIRYYDVVSPGTWADNFALNQTWASSNNPPLALGQSGNDIILGTNCTVNFNITDTILYLSQYNASGTLLAQPADPTRSGYTFNGWNNTNASGTPWNFTTTIIVGNTSLYANWTENPTPTSTPTPVPTSSGNGGNDDNNADSGPVSPNGTFTTNDGGLTLHHPAGSSIIVTVFKDYFNGAAAPSGVSYLTVYDVHSTAGSGTSVTLVFRVNASVLEEKGLTPEDISILHYFDGGWHRMKITLIELINGEYLFTVTSDRTSPFMIAYNVDGSSFPLEAPEETSTPTSTPTTSPTQGEPTGTVSTTTSTEATPSPVPIIGIIAGLGVLTLLIRRE